MKQVFTFNTLCSFVLVLSFFSCSSPENKNGGAGTSDSASVSVTYKDAVEEFKYNFADESKKFIFQNTKGQDIKLPSGTTIKVPGSCFVDKNGKPVGGNVELKFEEYLSAGSIITSGISMKYTENGKRNDFESAGMFRISASQNGEELFIAKGKSLEVGLATTDADKDFNLYFSNSGDGSDWAYEQPAPAAQNTGNPNRAQSPQSRGAWSKPIPPRPFPPVAYSAEGKYFDLNLSHLHTENLKSLIGVVWQYAGNNPKNDPANNTKIFARNWDYVNIVPMDGNKRGVYNIVLRNNDTTVKTIAQPVYRGAVLDAENEIFAKELGEFNRRMEEASEQEKQNFVESAFVRLINIKGMGLYNCDRLYNYEDVVPILAQFDFGTSNEKYKNVSVYHIGGNGMAVIPYPPGSGSGFKYSLGEINKLVAILPDQEICIFSAVRFKNEAPSSKQTSPVNFTFKLKHTGVKAVRAQDIDAVLDAI